MVRVLGIDPGTRLVGYGLIDFHPRAGRFTYLECGILRIQTNLDMANRLHQIATGVEELIAEFTPQHLALEAAFTGVNSSSALKLGQARGAIMVSAARHAVAVTEYAPAHVKKSVVGHGRATKADIQERVRLLCRLNTPPRADAADALALAICHGQRVTV